jgi:hypothetical protein
VTTRPRGLFLVAAAVVQFLVWLLAMGRYAGDRHASSAVPAWLVLEAVLAVLIGIVATDRSQVVTAVLGGWLLQAVHFAVVTPKDDAHNMWAVGLFLQAFLAVLALGLAATVHVLTRYAGRRRRG